MKNILVSAAIAASALAPLSVAAGPSYTLYDFKELTSSCSDGTPVCPGGVNNIGSMSIGIQGANASLSVLALGGFFSLDTIRFDNTNVAFADFRDLNALVDLQGETCDAAYRCEIRATFATDNITGGLTGSFYLLTGFDMYEMSSNADGLWSGYFMSDNGPHSFERRPVFTGVFTGGAIMAVPEPGTLALLGIGFAGLMFSARRRS